MADQRDTKIFRLKVALDAAEKEMASLETKLNETKDLLIETLRELVDAKAKLGEVNARNEILREEAEVMRKEIGDAESRKKITKNYSD